MSYDRNLVRAGSSLSNRHNHCFWLHTRVKSSQLACHLVLSIVKLEKLIPWLTAQKLPFCMQAGICCMLSTWHSSYWSQKSKWCQYVPRALVIRVSVAVSLALLVYEIVDYGCHVFLVNCWLFFLLHTSSSPCSPDSPVWWWWVRVVVLMLKLLLLLFLLLLLLLFILLLFFRQERLQEPMMLSGHLRKIIPYCSQCNSMHWIFKTFWSANQWIIHYISVLMLGWPLLTGCKYVVIIACWLALRLSRFQNQISSLHSLPWQSWLAIMVRLHSI